MSERCMSDESDCSNLPDKLSQRFFVWHPLTTSLTSFRASLRFVHPSFFRVVFGYDPLRSLPIRRLARGRTSGGRAAARPYKDKKCFCKDALLHIPNFWEKKWWTPCMLSLQCHPI